MGHPREFYPYSGLNVVGGLAGLAMSCGLGLLDPLSWPLLVMAVLTAFYRERVVVDPRCRTITVRRSLFVLPLGRELYPFQAVTSVVWADRRLALHAGGRRLLLARGRADDARVGELRRLVGLA